MRERPDVVGETDVRMEVETERRRIDLSVPQVAGSALAAVIAAKLASSFGVYGTILGAGLVSVIATCGGSLFQHFFKRTGEQIRNTTAVTAKRGGAQARTQVTVQAVPAPGEFTEGTVYRARVKSWKRPLVAAALVFGVTMTGITVYELASGHSMSGGGSTTVGNAFSGGGSSSGSKDAEDPGDTGESGDPGSSEESGEPGSGGDAPTTAPSGSGAETGGAAPSGSASPDGGSTPSPTPSAGATEDEGSGDATSPAPDASATPPEPSASSRSGTGDPGQGGPAAP
ncbi:hypothetical protein GCM10010377_05560 [Streptomyces viridiviolaceus]|uniref:Uncharacterized protein n=1 Tax=Streptomyces viridiviolaceus TaxID=68282 RepID=A0ABW2E4E8_9ACTN|nr:hypothetical protein [Streptomyces viridiviolaceus]GHB18698.1 hypothetical protein GCM10010377_05560 [Streptomyces viridiviolaceus]